MFLQANPTISKVYAVAHSLGNKAVVDALANANQIIDATKRASLWSIAEDCDVAPQQRLDAEVRFHGAILGCMRDPADRERRVKASLLYLLLTEGSLGVGIVDMLALRSSVDPRNPLKKRLSSAANRLSTSRRNWANWAWSWAISV